MLKFYYLHMPRTHSPHRRNNLQVVLATERPYVRDDDIRAGVEPGYIQAIRDLVTKAERSTWPSMAEGTWEYLGTVFHERVRVRAYKIHNPM